MTMTSPMNSLPIVAGVDGSASALHAALWAADEAANRQASLRLVSAVGISALVGNGWVALPQSYFDALEADGRRQLTDAEQAIRKVHPDLDIAVELPNTSATPALIEESRSARLIVLGSRGQGGFSGIVVGSTAVSVVEQASCPVAVIRGHSPEQAPPDGGPVVVGVDGSVLGEGALAMAFDEASWRRAELVAVHTWAEFASDSAYAYARQFLVGWDGIDTREHEVLAERLAGWQEKYPDVTVRRVVTRDRPVPALLANSVDAQLLVVGSRGHGEFTGALLGSTSQALIYHATCPLLVVHPAATD
jgi:nucleotide-binding universal stress UspA family protein